MRPDAHKVIMMAIENGVQLGIRRAFKHTDQPNEEVLIEHVTLEVSNQIYEWFKFEGDV